MKAGNILAGAVGAVALSVIFAMAPWPALTGLSDDVLMKVRIESAPRPERPDRVAVIAIDNASLADPALFQRPQVLWTPTLASLVDATRKSGSKAIGLDLVLPVTAETELPGYDLAFRQALRRAAEAGVIVLGQRYAASGTPAVAPHPGQVAAAGADNVHAMNVARDQDGVVRRVPSAFARINGMGSVRAFAAELAARAGAILKPMPTARIDWRNFAQGVPIYGLSETLNCIRKGATGRLADKLKNRIVLIGTVLEGEDRLATPLRFGAPQVVVSSPCTAARRSIAFPVGDLPGVLVQAVAVDTWLDGTPVTSPGFMLSATLIVMLTVCATSLVLARWPIQIAGILTCTALWSVIAAEAAVRGVLLPWLDGITAATIGWAAANACRVTVLEREERSLRDAFGRFLSPAVVERLMNAGVPPSLGGERRSMTVLMTDLENYTSFAEGRPPEKVAAVLNSLFAIVVEEVEARGGFVAQFAGDASVSFFGAPNDDPDQARHAVEAALAIVRRSRFVQAELSKESGLAMSTRCGIDSGELFLGHIGSAKRLNYAAVGEAINHTQRLQETGKGLAAPIIASARTANACRSDFPWEDRGAIALKGIGTTQVFVLEA